ncbi:hypothetical protein GCM10022244_42800 [Streptomyces gulbargensis]|uniref:Uncharacterized protein n=1 Tax=Streptomyces gulbargensis TaxID=364901 RepID=A0ABP7MSS4_9ACTN
MANSQVKSAGAGGGTWGGTAEGSGGGTGVLLTPRPYRPPRAVPGAPDLTYEDRARPPYRSVA